MITVINNFICTHPSRLNVLTSIFDRWVNVLNDYKFIINYDTDVYYKEIENLYKNNIKDCDFTNDIGGSWVDKTIQMVKSANTPYIYYLFEDVGFEEIVTKHYFEEMLSEFYNSNAKHLMLGKTNKYSDPNRWVNTDCEMHKTIRTFNSNVPYNCCYPVAGVWDKELFLSVLDTVKNNRGSQSSIKQIDGIEDLSNLYRNQNVKQACPLRTVTDHIQPPGTRQAKR